MWGKAACTVLLLLTPLCAAKSKEPTKVPLPPDLLMEGGRKLTYERSFGTEKELLGKPGFWTGC